MGFLDMIGWPRDPAQETRAASIENPTVPVSSEAFLSFFGVGSADLPNVTIDNALTVPAVWAAVSFLSRTLASLPLHAYRSDADGSVRVAGKLAKVVGENWNDEQSGFKARQLFWQQVFTGGRGLAWIERNGQNVEAIWPMDPAHTTISRNGLKTVYRFNGRDYPAADIIDVPFMLKSNGINHYGPITKAAKAIQLAIAMNDYGSKFFAGGGVPPLALTGPLPQGPEAMKRAMADIYRAIEVAKQSDKPVFPMPPGHELKPVGFDPDKGQMIEARRFQVEEIARAFQLPPVFLQDLSRATFSNAEQQNLHLVQHLIGQWAESLESEMNLKLFGRMNNSRFVKHNLDGILRGDFKTRADAVARLVQVGVYTPNDGRGYMGQDASTDPAANQLYMQGATIPLGTTLAETVPASNEDISA